MWDNKREMDIVSLAHNVSFWAQKLKHSVSFWAQKLIHYNDFWLLKNQREIDTVRPTLVDS